MYENPEGHGPPLPTPMLALTTVYFQLGLPKTRDLRWIGTKTVLKSESFAFFGNSRFMTTEYYKTRIT